VPSPDEKSVSGVDVVSYRPQWGTERREIAAEQLNIYACGQVKAAAQPLLMARAEQRAARTGWYA
jgi:hypothetical protein